MDKVQGGNRVGNEQRQSDPFVDLEARVKGLADAGTNDERRSRRQELGEFVGKLSPEDRRTIRQQYRKQTFEGQKALHTALVSLNGSFGPAASLLREIREDEEAWADSLPLPPQRGPAPLSEAVWRKFYLDSGFSEQEATAKAAKAAAEERRTPDDIWREFYAEHGMPPEYIESEVARHRRNEKWSAVLDATRAAELAEGNQRREDGLRKACPEIAKYAQSVARDLLHLVMRPEGAAALRDGGLLKLFEAIDRAILAGQPNAPHVESAGGMRIVVRRPADEAFWRWNDIAFAAGELADAMAEGGSAEANQIAQVARDVDSITPEARRLVANLKRESRRPPKAALDAAEALRARRLSWSDIATVLDARRLRLEPHTPENVRKSVLARRRRRRGEAPPATKG